MLEGPGAARTNSASVLVAACETRFWLKTWALSAYFNNVTVVVAGLLLFILEYVSHHL